MSLAETCIFTPNVSKRAASPDSDAAVAVCTFLYGPKHKILVRPIRPRSRVDFIGTDKSAIAVCALHMLRSGTAFERS